MKVEPYLFFNGRCEEAIAFYKEALGAEVTMQMRMNESPEPPTPGCVPPGFENKIMHANLRIGSTMLMMSDGNSDLQPSFRVSLFPRGWPMPQKPSAPSPRCCKAVAK